MREEDEEIGSRVSGTRGVGVEIGRAKLVGELVRRVSATTMNRQGMAVGLDQRAQALIDATYRALQYQRSPRGGSWLPGLARQ